MEFKAISVGEMSFCLSSFLFLSLPKSGVQKVLEFEDPMAANILPDCCDKDKPLGKAMRLYLEQVRIYSFLKSLLRAFSICPFI